MWPGFKSRPRSHLWVEFAAGSLPCHEGFSPGTPVFPSPQKLAFPNSNLTRNQVDKEALCGCATFKSLFIYLLRGYLIIFVFVDEFPVGNVCNFFLMASISVRFEEYPSKGLVKRYGGGGGGLAGKFGNVVDKKYMPHPHPSAQK